MALPSSALVKLAPSPAYNTPPLDERSRYLRRLIVDGLEGGGRGHTGASFSLVEILRVLYDDVLRYRPSEPKWEGRDRFILSKGHGCLALYALLADKKFIAQDELLRQCRAGALLGGHPEDNIPGVEACTGALGHGMPIGVGMAMALRLKKNPARVVTVVGDGESNEGSIWEAAMHAAKHRLSQFTVIVDYNKLQSYGFTTEVLDLEPFADKWRAFGFAVQEVDGHDVHALQRVFSALPFDADKPNCIIAHTIKGKGIPDAEYNPEWHHRSNFSPEEIATMRAALRSVA